MSEGLERFVRAQNINYEDALEEIKGGQKRSHWMWYVFPQIRGLGRSSMAQHYAIQSRKEAEGYLAHPVLGARLREISGALLKLESCDAGHVMGYPDDMKLKSSMTLFAEVSGEALFQQVLDKFFDGERDPFTLKNLD